MPWLESKLTTACAIAISLFSGNTNPILSRTGLWRIPSLFQPFIQNVTFASNALEEDGIIFYGGKAAVAGTAGVGLGGLATEEAIRGCRAETRVAEEVAGSRSLRTSAAKATARGGEADNILLPNRGTPLKAFPTGPRIIAPVVVEDTGQPAWKAVHETKIKLFDANGNPITTNSLGYLVADLDVQHRLLSITQDALRELPQEQVASLTDDQIRKALTIALKKEPLWSYEFDPLSGKLKLKFKRSSGEITGEANAYSLIRKGALAAATTYGAYGAGASAQHVRDRLLDSLQKTDSAIANK